MEYWALLMKCRTLVLLKKRKAHVCWTHVHRYVNIHICKYTYMYELIYVNKKGSCILDSCTYGVALVSRID